MVTMTLSYTCCCFMINKMDCFLLQLRAKPRFHLRYPLIFFFSVQTLAPKAHASAQKSLIPSFKQASSKSTGDIIVTLFYVVYGQP